MDNPTTRKHAKFLLRRDQYAERYGVTLAAVDFWIKRGKEAGKIPPLDSAEAMRAWWPQVMHGAVPARFLNGQQPPTKEPRDFSAVRGLTIEANVEALRLTLAINKQLLDEALVHSDERTVGLRQRNYERCFDLMRKAEQSLTELQVRRGQLIDKEKAVDDVRKTVETLKLMRERMAQDILIELERRCGKRLRRVFAHLRALLEPAIEVVRAGEDQIFARGLRE
jgi:hypothetical protein